MIIKDLTRDECKEALENLKVPTDDWDSEVLQLAENNIKEIEYKEQESINVLERLIDEYFALRETVHKELKEIVESTENVELLKEIILDYMR